MSRVQCFWLEPTSRVRRRYRRYSTIARNCSPHGYHNWERPLDVVLAVWKEEDGRRWLQNCYSARDFEPSAFPVGCDHCSYVFADQDERQIFTELLYRRTDTGEETTLREAPAGAMWNADWMSDTYVGQDGRALCVKLPDGTDWLVDGPSANKGPGWTRNGDVPLITARPSIQTPGYHGFLTSGVLESC